MRASNSCDYPLQGFWRRLAVSPKSALILEYEGTLAPGRSTSGAALPYVEVKDRLLRMIGGRSRLAIVSERPVEQLMELLEVDRDLEVWGCNGAERLLVTGELVRSIPVACAHLEQVLCELENEGVRDRVETKGFGIAVHWRGLGHEEAAELACAVKRAMSRFLNAEYRVRAFNGGVEFVPRLFNWSRAVRHVMAELPEGAPVAYLGDDFTGDAFAAVEPGGVSVLVKGEYRASCAALWLRPPEVVCAFLSQWQSAVGVPNGPVC